MDLENKKFTRFLDVNANGIDSKTRTVTLAFSSEAPVLCDYGNEILDHSPQSVDLSRLKDGAPLLVDHDVTDQVGVIESASIDTDKIGRVTVRFGNSDRANEVFNDVQEGIRRHVSVGYRILEYVIESTAGGGEPDNYRITKWMPYEVSIVSVPADFSVGVGRSFLNSNVEKNIMSDSLSQSARDKEANRIEELTRMGEVFKERNLATTAIRQGHSIDQLRIAILESRENDEPVRAESATFEPPKREQRNYSIVNVIRGLSGDRSVDIGYETELNQELQRNRGHKAKGFSIPMQELTKRAAVNAGGIGANLVESVYEPNMMVDFLRNKSVVLNSGAQSIQVGSGGNLIIPRQTSSATAEWLDLDGTDSISESNQTFDQVSLEMKTLTAMTTYTHRMLKQGLPDIESIIRNDLAQLFATQIDATALNGAAANAKIPTGILNQTGVSSITATGSIPTFAELVEMERLLADENIDSNGLLYLTTPTIGTTLKTVEKATNTAQFIWTDNGQGEGMVNGFKAAYTKNMPAGTVLLGQFRDLMIAYWGSIDIEVDPYGDNFKKGNTSVRAMIDLDMNVRRPESFCKLTVS